MTNHSCEGQHLESDFPLRPGASVYIRMANSAEAGSKPGCCECPWFRTMALAEVKWCTETAAAGTALYRVGLKYFEQPY
jgi:hypothetical protein